MRRSLVLAVSVGVLLAACSSDDTDTDASATTQAPAPPESVGTEVESDTESDADDDAPDPLRTLGRVDLQPTGNRVIEGPGDLFGGEVVEVSFDAEPRWILPAGVRDDPALAWLVADETGATHVVTHTGEVTTLELTIDPDLGPPIRVRGDTSSSPDPRLISFEQPLSDTRVVSDELDRILAALIVPTDRYAHGVLGDDIEAGGFGIVGGLAAINATRVAILLDEPDVIEGISPMLADVDDDQIVEVIVTVANANTGARIVAYEIDGTVVAETEPIGRGNRWRNQLAVAPTGPDGEVELIDVRTPHIGGTLQFFQRSGERFELVAAIDGYSTHEIGSRNLDLGIVTDADGDGRLDVVLPTQDRRELHAVTRTTDGAEVVGAFPLEAPLSTNVAAQRTGDGDDPEAEAEVIYAVGTSDGTVLLIG